MVENDQLTEEIKFDYESFEQQPITKANFKKLAERRIIHSNMSAQQVADNNAMLENINKRIEVEQDHIGKQNYDKKMLKDSIHYELVMELLNSREVSRKSINYLKLIYLPLLQLVKAANVIIEEYNNSAIFTDVDKTITALFELRMKELLRNQDELKEIQRNIIDRDLKNQEKRLIKLEAKSGVNDKEQPSEQGVENQGDKHKKPPKWTADTFEYELFNCLHKLDELPFTDKMGYVNECKRVVPSAPYLPQPNKNRFTSIFDDIAKRLKDSALENQGKDYKSEETYRYITSSKDSGLENRNNE